LAIERKPPPLVVLEKTRHNRSLIRPGQDLGHRSADRLWC